MQEYRRLTIIFFVLFFCIFVKVDAKINDLPLLGKAIYVDPGHGGTPNTKWKQIRFDAL